MVKRLFVSLSLILSISFAGNAYAIPLKFDVSGHMYLYNDNSSDALEQSIGGYLITDGDPSCVPSFAEEDGGGEGVFLTTPVEEFCIKSYGYNFYGSSGSINRSCYDDYISLYGNGNWTSWLLGTESCFSGYNINCGSIFGGDIGRTLYDGYHISNIDFKIALSANQAPVPEPATAILLLVGAPFMYSRSKRRG